MTSLDTKCSLFIFMSLRDPIFFFSYYKSAYCQFFTNEIFYLLQILVSNFLIRQILNGQDVVFFSIFTCPSSQYCTSNIFQIKYFCYFMIFFSYNDLKLVFFLIFFSIYLCLPHLLIFPTWKGAALLVLADLKISAIFLSLSPIC